MALTIELAAFDMYPQEYESENEDNNAAISRMRNKLLADQQETAQAEANSK